MFLVSKLLVNDIKEWHPSNIKLISVKSLFIFNSISNILLYSKLYLLISKNSCKFNS